MTFSKCRTLMSTFCRPFFAANTSVRVASSFCSSELVLSHHNPTLAGHQNQSLQLLRFASSVRRRRGDFQSVGKRSGEDEERLAPHAVKDSLVFRQEADKLLDKVEAALRPMEKHNSIFILSRDDSSLTLDLAPEDGSYKIEINQDANRIHMTTAISGHFNYVLSASTGEWVDEKDGHSLEGMLVRDLIRQCNGLPDL